MTDKTPPLYTPDPLFVGGYVGWARIGGKGRGAIALKPILKGTIFERCPVLTMPWQDLETPAQPPVLENYVYGWGDEDADGMAEKAAIGLAGHMLLYNHSYDPNAEVQEDRANMLIEFVAIRDIMQGEEITFDYGIDLWFDYKP